MQKANLVIDQQDVTVYFEFGDNLTEVLCHYCGQQGNSQVVHIDSAVAPTGELSTRTKLYKAAVAVIRKELFEGRGLCELGSLCDEKLITDRHASKEITY
jgi:hypothetical protein